MIASDITPHRQLLGKGPGYDWFFPVGEVQALAHLITAARTDDAKAQRLAQGRRDFVRANYGWPALAAATLEQYRAVVRQTMARRV